MSIQLNPHLQPSYMSPPYPTMRIHSFLFPTQQARQRQGQRNWCTGVHTTNHVFTWAQVPLPKQHNGTWTYGRNQRLTTLRRALEKWFTYTAPRAINHIPIKINYNESSLFSTLYHLQTCIVTSSTCKYLAFISFYITAIYQPIKAMWAPWRR